MPAVEAHIQPAESNGMAAEGGCGPAEAGPVLIACAARYLDNLAALYQSNPPLAARIDALPFASLPPLEPTRDGHLTVRLAADDGKPVYLHSRYRPFDEARSLLETVNTADNPAFFVTGLGLGYHVAELERTLDRPLLIVAEDDPRLVKLALCCVDLSAPLADGRLLLLDAADKSSVHGRLRPRQTDIMLGVQFVVAPHARRYHAAFQDAARQELTQFVTWGRLQIVTTVKNARITCKNVAFNLPVYLSNPGIEPLKDRAAGCPAVIVAAGPSLARNVDQLPGLRGRAVLIAVQTVFKTLLERGCPPHFVTSLDFHEISCQFFSGLDDAHGAALVAEPKATWHVPERFPGRRHLLHNDFVDALLREAAPRRAKLKAGTTVAHLAFYLAEHLGCDPIILVGQDLAYSEGMYYPPGMPIEQIWQPELGRFYTIESKQWERICRARPILRVVKDIHGRDAYSDEQLYNYAQQFESDFAASKARVIHACEGGMRLAGAEIMTLREAAERFCTRALPEGMFARDDDRERHSERSEESRRDPGERLESGAAQVRSQISRGACPEPGRRARNDDVLDRDLAGRDSTRKALAALRSRLDDLAKVRQIATEMLDLLERLERLTDRPAEFNRVVARVDELRTQIQRLDHVYRLVIDVSQLAELRRVSADRRFGAARRETAETARRRLARDREFVRSFLDGCAFLEEMLPEAMRRLEAAPT